jgi:hypothetical protein
LTALFLFRKVLRRNGRHLVLKNFTQRDGRLEGVVKSNQDIAESADMSFAAHSHGLLTLLPEALVEFCLSLVVLPLECGHKSSKKLPVEVVVVSSAGPGVEPVVDIACDLKVPLHKEPTRSGHPVASHQDLCLLRHGDMNREEKLYSFVGLCRDMGRMNILPVGRDTP